MDNVRRRSWRRVAVTPIIAAGMLGALTALPDASGGATRPVGAAGSVVLGHHHDAVSAASRAAAAAKAKGDSKHKKTSGAIGDPIATGLNAPFGVGTGPGGRVFVAETGAGDFEHPGPGRVLEIKKDKTQTVASNVPFVTDADGRGDEVDYLFNGQLVRQRKDGRTTSADLAGYEAANNPDQGNTYGMTTDLAGLAGAACWSTVPPDLAQSVSRYSGVVDSNPFRLAVLPGGTVAVADAAGNDILAVDKNGKISTLAVLPPLRFQLTAADLANVTNDNGDGFPQCVLDAVPVSGVSIDFEPVPTGLAVGPDHSLYVGLLPGGEIPGGARVLRVDMQTGRIETLASGLTSVTGVDVGKGGAVYVAELFGGDGSGDIVKLTTKKVHGSEVVTGRTAWAVPLPNDVAAGDHGLLYASINSLLPDGAVVPITQ